jgi:hypothetical protein
MKEAYQVGKSQPGTSCSSQPHLENIVKKSRILTFICVCLTLVLIAGIDMGNAAQLDSINGGGSPADFPWLFQIAESVSGNEVGQYASLAFHPASNKPYISHYDATQQELHLTYPVDVGGNCGTDNAWYCEVVDTDGDVGKFSSVDLYYNSSSSDRKIGVAYYDATNAALKVAIWSCSLIGSCGWSISTIQQGIANVSSFGRYASLKFDSLGAAHIAYHSENSFGDEALRYVSYVGSGGNCGVGSALDKWECDIVESGPNTGTHISLDLTGNDAPYIAFYDISPGEMRVCNHTGNSWACATIDNVSYGFPSIALDQSNRAHIAYYDGVSGMLKYAHYVGSGGNCGLNAYRCDNITAIGTGLTQVGISLAMDTGNTPVIAYQNASDPMGFSTLDIARPISAYVGKVAGNCGPMVGIIPQWQCDTLDDAAQGGGGGHLYEADYVSVDVGITGLASVAYYEYDDYYGEGRLKYAYQQRVYDVFLPLVIK